MPFKPIMPDQERRNPSHPLERQLGHVVSIDGGYAKLQTTATELDAETSDFWSIGRLIAISTGHSRVVGLIYKIETPQGAWQQGSTNPIEVFLELVGEVRDIAPGRSEFSRGINTYPPLGSLAHRIRSSDLAVIHQPVGRQTASVGHLSQDNSIPAVVCIDDMLKRHFAIVGSTGTGKSSAVSLLLRKIVENRPGLRVLILDPHNEYAAVFPDNSVTISTKTLELPFWLFQHEELCDVVFRNRDGVEDEKDALRDLVPLAKSRFSQAQAHQSAATSLRRTSTPTALSTDTPVPYRLSDLFALIEDEIGRLEGSHDRAVLKSLKARLTSLVNDPRYRFMFAQRAVDDNMETIISQIFRFPVDQRPITAFQLAGLPGDVVNSVVSVVTRLAFDVAMWSNDDCEVLVLCEEAHRYVPLDHRQGFGPTQRAIARIAKEGRKYGAYLGVVTQRPGELDPTILSQCSTVFSMRLANDNDQEIIRSAIADSSASTISFLSSIGNQEAIAFGEGIATPMRMRFADLPRQHIPGTASADQSHTGLTPANTDVSSIVEAMRHISERKPAPVTTPTRAL